MQKRTRGKISKNRLLAIVLLLFSINSVIANTNIVFSNTPSTAISPVVSALKGEYEFIYFYGGNCQHCLSFTPTLKLYSDNSGILVQAFVVGAGYSTSFPNSSVVEQEVIEQYFGKGAKIAVPALFILNRNNYHAYPVSSGALSYLDLATRMNDLAPKIWRHEKAEINDRNVSSQLNQFRGNNV